MSEKTTATVNMVTDDPNTGELVLYFVEDGPWPTSEIELEERLSRIQDKILDAVDAAIDGGVAANYPKGLRVVGGRVL